MVSEKLKQRLVEQIGNEFNASQQYLGIAVYFGLQNLDTWADIFYKQSAEEHEHGMKILRFLVNTIDGFTLPAIPEGKSSYSSAIEAIQWSLNNERQVTKQFNDMAAAALEEKDFTSFQFLQWFIQEQVEEEASMERYVTLLQAEGNPVKAEMILAELEEHGSDSN